MAEHKRRYPKEEFARRGDALFESKVRPKLKPGDDEKFVAIDIETGEYEIHSNEMTAVNRLYKRIPDAQVWLVQAGTGYLDRFGGAGVRGRK